MEKNLRGMVIDHILTRKALFIDRDGTINVDCPYCHKPSDLRIYDDSVSIMKEFARRGFHIVIVTNQSGIGRGYFTEREMQAFNSELISRLRREGIEIAAIYHCPHRPEEGCDCRKPGTGLIKRAERELGINLSESIIVGDRDDIEGELARKLNMKYMILNREKKQYAD